MQYTNVFRNNLRAYVDGVRIIANKGGTSCFSGNTLIDTKLGPLKISLISKGDEVASYGRDVEFKKVVNVFRYKNNKKTIRVNLRGGGSIIATEDHKFYFKGGWVSLKEILSLKYGNLEEDKGVQANVRGFISRAFAFFGL